jgi:hypothetical protein
LGVWHWEGLVCWVGWAGVWVVQSCGRGKMTGNKRLQARDG